ncbi:MAG: DNA mismatch repair protein MutS, partial [Candidatus Marinimicrobia bacterium]|nr:DNA mismatch repair protein MutS [Candidatus Neomarinimicrobiota bacterium]
DIARQMSTLSANRSSARELNALRSTLELIPEILELVSGQASFESLIHNLNPLLSVTELIECAILDENIPLSIKEGGFIKDGFSVNLDEYRHLVHHGKEWIAQLQATERERLGISSLKVAYNKVFGYYIEVTKTNLDKIPETYIRKQTLVNNERFITPELKEYEEKLLNAEERMSQIEYDLFQEIRLSILKEVSAIQKDAEAIATLDIVSNLAEIAVNRHYTRPEINESSSIEIKDGRHPVVEFLLPPGDKFIANDLMIDNQNDQILIITGPNMAGKSTYLRQVGLIVLMAQIGSFVPASSAKIGIVDKIFTRVGASDNLAAGESTFLMEMNETANILNNATPQSLILLDEIGRGTSTYDGMSIAWAVTEYLHENPKVAAKTLFATHYHELTELESLHPRIKNYNVAVKEYGDRVIFLRKIIPGGCDRSYGIHVAQMAGIPREVIFRAKEILLNLSDSERTLPTENEKFRKLLSKNENQLGLFDAQESELRKALTEVDVDNLTPLEALQKLDELKRQFGV